MIVCQRHRKDYQSDEVAAAYENKVARLKGKICNLIQKCESVDQGLYGNFAVSMDKNTIGSDILRRQFSSGILGP